MEQEAEEKGRIPGWEGKNGFSELLGTEVEYEASGEARVVLNIEPRHRNPAGAVHGGCVYALCDCASGRCTFAGGIPSVSCNASIQYMRSTIGVKKLIAEAKTVKAGARLYFNEVTVTDENGTLVAAAQITQFLKQDMGKKEE